MTDNEINDTIIDDTERSIRRAKPKTFVVFKDAGYLTILSEKEFKALKPVQAEFSDADVSSYTGAITPKLIAELTALMENPPFVESADATYNREDIAKAKHVTGISFTYGDRTAILLSNGTLNIGCQKHPLSVWAKTAPQVFGPGLSQYLSYDNNAAARDALIPVLKAKLKELRAA